MRIQPPKSKKKYFTKKEYKAYFLKHLLYIGDGTTIELQAFFPDENGYVAVRWKDWPLTNFIQMFPYEHQWVVKEIIEEFEKKSEK